MQFILGIAQILNLWAHQAGGWLLHEERLLVHFVRRLMAVEKRLRGTAHVTFLWRFLRYAVHHYHLLPGWVKVAKLIVLFGLIFGQPLWKDYQAGREYRHYYDFYYQHGFSHYRHYLPEEQAIPMAQEYASRFAEYYTSPSYREALRTALPAQPSQKLEQAVQQSRPEVRELQLAEVGYDLIKHFEGLRLKPYKDAVGKFTIGYGHLMRPGEAYTQITEKTADTLLRKDVAIAEMVVKQHVKAPLKLSEFSALVVLVYNIGGYQFSKSTLLKMVNAGNYAGAAEQMLRWERAGGKVLRGLTRRRQAEYLLFTGKWQKRQES